MPLAPAVKPERNSPFCIHLTCVNSIFAHPQHPSKLLHRNTTEKVVAASNSEEAFRFTDLPGEQRNSIYRHLFDDITTPDSAFHVWKELEGLPRYPDLKAYSAIIATCRQINTEASTIFEKEYIPRLTVYVEGLQGLWQLSKPATDNKLKGSGASFLVRTRTQVSDGSFNIGSLALFSGSFGAKVVSAPYAPLSPWSSAGEGVQIRTSTKDGKPLEKQVAYHKVFYQSKWLQQLPLGYKGMVFFKHREDDVQEGTTILEGRFNLIGWCSSRFDGDEMKEHDWWDMHDIVFKDTLASQSNDYDALPAMELLW